MKRGPKLLWTGVFLLIGVAAATVWHWPALTNPLVYKSDVRQSPHWAAYHTDSFRDDDLLLTLAAHNESPLQNLIYYVGTNFVDMVTLGKWLAVITYGLIAALFFWFGESMLGFRGGALASLCITFFPDTFEYCAGGFSKAWMIPLILVAAYALHKGFWKWLIWILPLGAVAYPVSAVYVGALALAFLLLELPSKGMKTRPLFVCLCVGSALAVAILLVKYIFPPEGIGPLTPGDELYEMAEMYEDGLYEYLPLHSLPREMARRVARPFPLFSAMIFLLFLGRERVWWPRVMTAILVASMVFYMLAYQFFMSLYQPTRYTRYAIAVALALWLAANWERVLGRIPWRLLQGVAFVLFLASGTVLCWSSYEIGKDVYSRERVKSLNEFIATLPDDVLITGHPNYMDDIPIQARRSVWCNYKLAHPWYSEFYPEMRRRTLATFDALYTGDFDAADRLYEEEGVTHLVVVKRFQTRKRINNPGIYVDPYNKHILRLAARSREFAMSEPPQQNIVYEDNETMVVALPIDAAE